MAAYTFGVCLHASIPFSGSVLPIGVSMQPGSGKIHTYMEVSSRRRRREEEDEEEAEVRWWREHASCLRLVAA